MRLAAVVLIATFLCIFNPQAEEATKGVSPSEVSWYLLTPPRFTHNLSAVAFCDDQHGWAVGDSGSCLRTDDGGMSWTPELTGVTGHFTDAAGVKARVYTLADGSIWLRYRDISGFRKVDLGMTAPRDIISVDNHLWVVGDNGEVCHSRNGGKLWELRQIPDRPSLTCVAFSDSVHGYAIGWWPEKGTWLFQTHDGGKIWTSKSYAEGRPFCKIATLSPDVVVVMGCAKIISDRDRYGQLKGLPLTSVSRLSTDRGETWKGILCHSIAAEAICYVSPSIGFSTSTKGVSRTGDGGKNWSPIDSAQTTGIRGLAVIDQNTVVGVGAFGRIVRTTDCGQTWSTVHSSVHPNIESVTALTATSAVVRSEAGLFHTGDGGYTWQRAFDQRVAALDFVNDTLGFVSDTDHCFYRTMDGGQTWNICGADTQFQEYHLYDLAFIDEARGSFLLGALLRFTEDTGRTWTSTHWSRLTWMHECDFIDTLHGWTVGIEGYVLKSVDGGRSWRGAPSPEPGDATLSLEHFTFIDSLNGWTSARDGRLYRTRNGGESWSKLPFSGFFRGVELTFFDSLSGWTCCLGTIYRTTDGGNTWEKQEVPGLQPINSLSFSSKTRGLAVGMNWTILSTQRPPRGRIAEPPKIND